MHTRKTNILPCNDYYLSKAYFCIKKGNIIEQRPSILNILNTRLKKNWNHWHFYLWKAAKALLERGFQSLKVFHELPVWIWRAKRALWNYENQRAHLSAYKGV